MNAAPKTRSRPATARARAVRICTCSGARRSDAATASSTDPTAIAMALRMAARAVCAVGSDASWRSIADSTCRISGAWVVMSRGTASVSCSA